MFCELYLNKNKTKAVLLNSLSKTFKSFLTKSNDSRMCRVQRIQYKSHISISSCPNLVWILYFFFFFFFYFFKFYCYSITVVCIFSPSLHPTPANPTSLSHLQPPPWFCPCVLYSSSWKPLSPLYFLFTCWYDHHQSPLYFSVIIHTMFLFLHPITLPVMFYCFRFIKFIWMALVNKSYSFQMCTSMIYDLYIVLRDHRPKPNPLSPYIWPPLTFTIPNPF